MSNKPFQLEHFLHNCYLRSVLGRTSIILEDVYICSDCYFFYPYFYVEKTTITLFNNFWLSLNNTKGTASDNCQKLALKRLAGFCEGLNVSSNCYFFSHAFPITTAVCFYFPRWQMH